MSRVFREQTATVSSIGNYDPTDASMLASRVKLVTAHYDFAVSGGAVSTLSLPLSAAIPNGASITKVLVKTTTAPTSGGSATISLGIAADADLLALTALNAVPYTAGTDVVTLAGGSKLVTTTAANPTGTTTMFVSIAVADLTAGNMEIALEYFL